MDINNPVRADTINIMMCCQKNVRVVKYRVAAIRCMPRLGASVLICSLLAAFPTAWSADGVSFNHDVLPILSDKCFHCHGPDAKNQDSEFRLDTREHAVDDLGGYFGIKPGDLEASELHRRIHAADDEQMPPKDAVRQLNEQEKATLDAWILAGAPYEAHWSFIPLPREVDVPDVGDAWAENEMDRFIYAEHLEAGVEPNDRASKEIWLRRVTFDLTGLPPTVAEIGAFLGDDSPKAYSNVVDRLLASIACAERLTTEWLDVARYSDSYGYQRDDARFVWPWRDWVIEAFHENMPYDDFITWQLAGDLLPNPTRNQMLATAFNRLHSHKKEGGVAVEEFRVENVADRTHTVGAAFMGLTFECARCHDHKYDPITTKDYYRLSSFFANVDERGLISFFTSAVPTPAMPLPTAQQEQDLKDAEQAIVHSEEELKRVVDDAQDPFESWLQNRQQTNELAGLVAHLNFDAFQSSPTDASEGDDGKKNSAAEPKLQKLANLATPKNQAHTAKANTLVAGKSGQAIKLTGDDPVEIPNTGHFSRDQPFSISLWINTPETKERAVIYRRSRGWDDAGSIGYELTKLGAKLSAKLTHYWPGNTIDVETSEFLEPNRWYHVAVTYDGSSKAKGLQIYIDGKHADTTIVYDHLTRQITEWGGERNLAIGTRYRDRGFKNGLVDEFYVFNRTLSALEVSHLYDGQALHQILGKPTDQLTAIERDQLREFFMLSTHEPIQQARLQLREARKQWNQAMDSTPAITVMRERSQPRPTFVLERGGYDSRGEQVTASTPEFMPKFPADQPTNRLGLARWLTSDDHPLTARVTVNRYWQLMFGTGLVRTPEDFGAQGERPTHPELLDWLARDFVDHGWNVRRLLRMMALSATYRQSAIATHELRDQDPENRLLARSFGTRLSAEMIRDNALATSGLLSSEVGGPPVKPYDISLSYKPSTPDKGPGLYRRSLYTFWQRTSPAPVMTTLNANKRDVCRLRREVAPSPLQALVMLNGTQFVEAARVMAGNLLAEHGENELSMVADAYRRLTSSSPTAKQVEILQQLFNEQLTIFQEQPQRANQLLAVGNAPSPTSEDQARHAAATVLVNSIMNLDECVRLQ